MTLDALWDALWPLLVMLASAFGAATLFILPSEAVLIAQIKAGLAPTSALLVAATIGNVAGSAVQLVARPQRPPLRGSSLVSVLAGDDRSRQRPLPALRAVVAAARVGPDHRRSPDVHRRRSARAVPVFSAARGDRQGRPLRYSRRQFVTSTSNEGKPDVRLLVAGAQGQLARAMIELAPSAADITAFALGRPALDLTAPASVLKTLADFKPDVIVNAAAYTAVDKAESEPDAAIALNADGPARLAEAADRMGAVLIHVSTDYVFDGSKPTPYVEDDPTAPLGAYGRSKLAGEEAVRAATARHIILRTAWVHSPFGANFVKTMLRLAADRPEVRVVDDQIGSPTYAPHLAEAILAISRAIIADPANARFGTYHAAGIGCRHLVRHGPRGHARFRVARRPERHRHRDHHRRVPDPRPTPRQLAPRLLETHGRVRRGAPSLAARRRRVCDSAARRRVTTWSRRWREQGCRPRNPPGRPRTPSFDDLESAAPVAAEGRTVRMRP